MNIDVCHKFLDRCLMNKNGKRANHGPIIDLLRTDAFKGLLMLLKFKVEEKEIEHTFAQGVLLGVALSAASDCFEMEDLINQIDINE